MSDADAVALPDSSIASVLPIDAGQPPVAAVKKSRIVKRKADPAPVAAPIIADAPSESGTIESGAGSGVADVAAGASGDDKRKNRKKKLAGCLNCPCVKIFEESKLSKKPKRDVGESALSVLKLWRKVCLDTTGKVQVLRVGHPKYVEAKQLFEKLYKESKPDKEKEDGQISE